LGIDISERTVSRLMPKRITPPSQTWRTLLDNHVRDFVSIDFFTVPTAQLRLLFVFIVVAHERRRVVHFNVTEHPTAAWTAHKSSKRFRKIRHRDIYYGTATESTETTFKTVFSEWAFGKYGQHQDVRDKIPTSND
jgi:hypothetical protein